MTETIEALSNDEAAIIVKSGYDLTDKELATIGSYRVNELAQAALEPKQKFYNRYYKESAKPLISGLPLPKDEDGAVRSKVFISCEFHANCDQVRFIDCVFLRCVGHERLGMK